MRVCAVSGVAGGAISLAAYTIVPWAQTSGALAPIAALRETRIVFGALIGAVLLGERLGPRRAIAAAVVLAGVLIGGSQLPYCMANGLARLPGQGRP